jgi:hypothetical protein
MPRGRKIRIEFDPSVLSLSPKVSERYCSAQRSAQPDDFNQYLQMIGKQLATYRENIPLFNKFENFGQNDQNEISRGASYTKFFRTDEPDSVYTIGQARADMCANGLSDERSQNFALFSWLQERQDGPRGGMSNFPQCIPFLLQPLFLAIFEKSQLKLVNEQVTTTFIPPNRLAELKYDGGEDQWQWVREGPIELGDYPLNPSEGGAEFYFGKFGLKMSIDFAKLKQCNPIQPEDVSEIFKMERIWIELEQNEENRFYVEPVIKAFEQIGVLFKDSTTCFVQDLVEFYKKLSDWISDENPYIDNGYVCLVRKNLVNSDLIGILNRLMKPQCCIVNLSSNPNITEQGIIGLLENISRKGVIINIDLGVSGLDGTPRISPFVLKKGMGSMFVQLPAACFTCLQVLFKTLSELERLTDIVITDTIHLNSFLQELTKSNRETLKQFKVLLKKKVLRIAVSHLSKEDATLIETIRQRLPEKLQTSFVVESDESIDRWLESSQTVSPSISENYCVRLDPSIFSLAERDINEVYNKKLRATLWKIRSFFAKRLFAHDLWLDDFITAISDLTDQLFRREVVADVTQSSNQVEKCQGIDFYRISIPLYYDIYDFGTIDCCVRIDYPQLEKVRQNRRGRRESDVVDVVSVEMSLTLKQFDKKIINVKPLIDRIKNIACISQTRQLDYLDREYFTFAGLLRRLQKTKEIDLSIDYYLTDSCLPDLIRVLNKKRRYTVYLRCPQFTEKGIEALLYGLNSGRVKVNLRMQSKNVVPFVIEKNKKHTEITFSIDYFKSLSSLFEYLLKMKKLKGIEISREEAFPFLKKLAELDFETVDQFIILAEEKKIYVAEPKWPSGRMALNVSSEDMGKKLITAFRSWGFQEKVFSSEKAEDIKVEIFYPQGEQPSHRIQRATQDSTDTCASLVEQYGDYFDTEFDLSKRGLRGDYVNEVVELQKKRKHCKIRLTHNPDVTKEGAMDLLEGLSSGNEKVSVCLTQGGLKDGKFEIVKQDSDCEISLPVSIYGKFSELFARLNDMGGIEEVYIPGDIGFLETFYQQCQNQLLQKQVVGNFRDLLCAKNVCLQLPSVVEEGYINLLMNSLEAIGEMEVELLGYDQTIDRILPYVIQTKSVTVTVIVGSKDNLDTLFQRIETLNEEKREKLLITTEDKKTAKKILKGCHISEKTRLILNEQFPTKPSATWNFFRPRLTPQEAQQLSSEREHIAPRAVSA